MIVTPVHRFVDLLSFIPFGSFYSADGIVVPHYGKPIQFTVRSGIASTQYLILVNNIQSGFFVTDVTGQAVFSVQLPLGEVVLQTKQANSTNGFTCYLTVRDYATWLSGIAQELEGIDTNIDETQSSFYIAQASAVDLGLAWGSRLLAPNDSGMDVNAYAEALQLISQSFRQFGGRTSGIYGVVAAITQVNPLVLHRTTDGPRWVLGFDYFDNGKLTGISNTPVIASNTFITADSVTNNVNVSTIGGTTNIGSVIYNPNLQRAVFIPPFAAVIGLNATYYKYVNSPLLGASGTYTLPGVMWSAALISLPRSISGLDMSSRLYMNIDNRGVFPIPANFIDTTNITLADAINAAIAASGQYDDQRIVISQPAGPLLELIEIDNIDDGTPVNSITLIGTGTITFPSSTTVNYQSYGDSVGPTVPFTPGQSIRLLSNSGFGVQLLIGYTNISIGTTDTFTYTTRYLVEVSHGSPISSVNLLSLNQSNGGEDGTTTGFGSYRGNDTTYNEPPAGTTTLTNVTSPVEQGSHSIHFTSTYYGDGPGIDCPVTAGQTYVFSIYVNPTVSENFQIQLISNAVGDGGITNSTPCTAGIWTRIYLSYLIPTGGTSIGAVVCKPFVGDNPDFCVDALQLEVGTTPSTWVPGGTSPAPSLPNGNVATYLSTPLQTVITSQNKSTDEGESVVSVVHGPGDASPAIFGTKALTSTATTVAPLSSKQLAVTTGTITKFGGPNIFPILLNLGGFTTNIFDYRYQITNINDDTATFSTSDVTIPPASQWIYLSDGTSETSVNSGWHQILSIDANTNTALIAYHGKRIQPQLPTLGTVAILNASSNTAVGTGVLAWNGTSMTWTAPGDTAGSSVAVPDNGHYVLTSNNGATLDILVVASTLTSGTYNIPVSAGFVNFTSSSESPSSGIFRFAALGESATAVSGTSFSGSDILTLANPVSTVYLNTDITPEVFMTRSVKSDNTFGDITVDINTVGAPGSLTTYNVNVYGSGYPDSWTSLANGEIVPLGIYDTKAFILTPVSAGESLSQTIKLPSTLLGYSVRINAWVRNNNDTASTNETAQIHVAFDVGGSVSSSTVLVPPGVVYPHLVTITVRIPVEATTITVSIENTGSDAFIVDRMAMTKVGFTGLYLGDATIPRTDNIQNFGELMYIWCPDSLNSNEILDLGIAVPVTSGLISASHNAQNYVEAFSVGQDVVGYFTTEDWNMATLSNMNVVSRSADRFSNVVPTMSNLVKGDGLALVSGDSYKLTYVSDQNQANCTLYNGILPFTNDTWSFTDAQTILITGAFDHTMPITMDYHILTQAETGVIDLSTFSDDIWFADYVLWNRHLSGIETLTQTIQLNFSNTYTATLPRRSDMDQINSNLIADNGVTQRTIPFASWRYIDSLTVNIDAAQFDSTAIYSFTYNQRITDPSRVVKVTAEIRGATSIMNLATATYAPFNINDPVDTVNKYYQIRMTFDNVTDVRDVRLSSVCVKGLTLASTPGL